MVNVYIVTREFDYEGEDILGVYSTKERAEQAIKNYKAVRPEYAWLNYHVRTFTLND